MTEAEYLKQMGKNIKAVRKSKKITGDMLCILAGMDRSAVNAIELGKKNSKILTLFKIANALNVDVKTFL